MKVYYSTYKLTPLKRLNRLSSMDEKCGVHIKGVLGDKIAFADYFPHLPLGDRHCDQFLSEFKFQNDVYDKKVFDFILKDPEYQKSKLKKFLNHQLWTGSERIESSILKYKLLHAHDMTFMTPLERGMKLRLDGNALFSREDYSKFLKEIPEKYNAQIEYIEDPLRDKDWSNLKIPSASDFIDGTPYTYYIYKPNCEFKPKTDAKVIYSSYLGSDLGRWHACCELMNEGDLNLIHGIISSGFFEGEHYFFNGNFMEGFIPDKSKVDEVYKRVANSDWKLLCSM